MLFAVNVKAKPIQSSVVTVIVSTGLPVKDASWNLLKHHTFAWGHLAIIGKNHSCSILDAFALPTIKQASTYCECEF